MTFCGATHVAEGLGHLAALLIHGEAVRQHAAVGRALVQRLRHQQRAVEPAAVLVGALEVEVDRRRHLGALRADALERQARVGPHVHDVGDLVVVRGLRAEQLRRVRARTRRRCRPARHGRATCSISSCVRGCSSPLSLCTNSGIGTPQVRWREMHQSGRLAIMPVMRCSPHAGVQRTPRMSRSVWARSPRCSMLMNHWGVARKITGVLWRQQCG